MDLILGPFADARIDTLTAAQLDAYEDLLNENDQDLYQWASEQQPTPDMHRAILTTIIGFTREKLD